MFKTTTLQMCAKSTANNHQSYETSSHQQLALRTRREANDWHIVRFTPIPYSQPLIPEHIVVGNERRDVCLPAFAQRAPMNQPVPPSLLAIGVAGLGPSLSNLDVYTASSIRETMATIRLISFDLVVVGLENAAIDVWELMRRVQSAWPRQRWMLLSAHVTADEEVIARSLGAGSNAHFTSRKLARRFRLFAAEKRFAPAATCLDGSAPTRLLGRRGEIGGITNHSESTLSQHSNAIGGESNSA